MYCRSYNAMNDYPTNAPANAKQQEAQKTDAERARDISYTINHAIACTATDVLSPFIGNYTQRYLGKRIELGCGHDHSTPCAHLPPKQTQTAMRKLSTKGFEKPIFRKLQAEEMPYKRLRPPVAAQVPQNNLKHWWIGEVVGDFGAVPVTIAVQRFFPSVMNAIRSIAEPVAAPLFNIGAKRSTRIWAEENNIARDAPEYKAHEKEVLNREMSHLPQAFMWTATSAAINIAAQRISGNRGELSHLIAGKLAGSSTSVALVLGFRSFAPHHAYRFDRFTSEHIFEPITQAVTGTSSSWQDKVEAEATATGPVKNRGRSPSGT